MKEYKRIVVDGRKPSWVNYRLPNEDKLLVWDMLIEGPVDSPYEGFTYKFKVKFPPEYPFKAPRISFLPGSFLHINAENSSFCEDLIVGEWGPTRNIGYIANNIYSAMTSTVTRTALKTELAKLFNNDYEKYKSLIIEHSKKNAYQPTT